VSCGIVEAVSSQSSTDNFAAAEVNCDSLSLKHSSPKKLVALPSETTVMVDGQKCVLRVSHVTGRLMACPLASGMYNKNICVVVASYLPPSN